MSIGAILVGIALLVLIVAYVARPLFDKERLVTAGIATDSAIPGVPALNRRAQLVARRDALYALIRELDTDHQTGKINDQDYQIQRQRYVNEAAAILKQLDTLPEEKTRARLDQEIEAAVLALRQTHPASPPPDSTPDQQFCTQCGASATPADKFCSQCGAPLRRTVVS
jgi:hypothetical protein